METRIPLMSIKQVPMYILYLYYCNEGILSIIIFLILHTSQIVEHTSELPYCKNSYYRYGLETNFLRLKYHKAKNYIYALGRFYLNLKKSKYFFYVVLLHNGYFLYIIQFCHIFFITSYIMWFYVLFFYNKNIIFYFHIYQLILKITQFVLIYYVMFYQF